MGKDQPQVRCEKLCQQPHKPRTSGHIVLWRTQRSRPDQGCFRVPFPGPKWRHCLPKSTWRITNTPTGTHFGDTAHHMQGDDELLVLIF